MFNHQVQEMFYRNAKAPEDLPWHRDEPGRSLKEAIDERRSPGTALDLGCGSGVVSVYMAKRRYQVTGIDLMPRTIEMAKERAGRENARVEWVHADLLEWPPSRQFEPILDSGCLHSLIGGDRRRYRAQLLTWLAPDGDYILGHSGREDSWTGAPWVRREGRAVRSSPSSRPS